MKNRILIFILFITLSYQGKSQQAKETTSAEPKTTFEVTVNGKTYQLKELEELSLDTLIRPKISIKLSDYKKFDQSTISFDYPKHLSYEASQDFGYKTWTLSGNSAVVIIFELDAKTSVAALMEEMMKKFGKKNCKMEDFKKEIGHSMLEGEKMHVTLAGQNLLIECFEIKGSDYKSRFIYFQDLLDNEQHTEEYKKVFNAINSSIVFKK